MIPCRSRRRRTGVIMLSLVLAAQAHWHPAKAATLDGVAMPDTMTVQGKTLRLNGMGLRTFTILHVHGFVAGLYVEDRSHAAAAILDAPGFKLLQIRYVHAASLERVQDQFRQGHKSNCTGGCPKENDAAFQQLLDTAQAVKPGDTNTYLYSPDGVQILFNGKSLVTIHNADFARRMLASMIGAHPPTGPLRDGLLGN